MAAARNQHFIIHIKAQCCWCKENLHSALNTGSSTVWCHVSNPFIYLPSGLSAQSCSEEGAGGCWARQRRVCRARRRLYRWCNGSDRRASVCFYRWHSWNTAGSSKASGQTWKRKKSLKHINIRWKHRIWAYLLVQEADPWSKGWIIIKILSITVESVPLKLSNKKFESEYMCLRLVKKKKRVISFSPDTVGTHLPLSLSLSTKSQMFLSNKQREMKRADVRAGDLPWGGKHFPVPSSPFRWLGSTGRRRCTPRCARTVCKHKNTDCSVCTASKI